MFSEDGERFSLHRVGTASTVGKHFKSLPVVDEKILQVLDKPHQAKRDQAIYRMQRMGSTDNCAYKIEKHVPFIYDGHKTRERYYSNHRTSV